MCENPGQWNKLEHSVLLEIADKCDGDCDRCGAVGFELDGLTALAHPNDAIEKTDPRPSKDRENTPRIPSSDETLPGSLPNHGNDNVIPFPRRGR